MSRWKKGLAGSALVLLLLLGGGIGLLCTTTGLHGILNAAARWVPGLSIARIEGGWRDLHLRNVRYDLPGINVSIGELHLALRPGCLKRGALCVDDVALQEVDVVIDSKKLSPSASKQPAESTASGQLRAPFPLMMRQILLHNIRVNVDGVAISLTDFTSGADWQQHALTLQPTHIRGLLIALPNEIKKAEATRVTAVNPPPLGETLKALFSRPLLPDMPDFTLPLDLKLSSLLGEQWRITGGSDVTVNRLLLKAQTQAHLLHLETLEIDSSLGRLHAQGEAKLTDSWPVQLSLNSVLNAGEMKNQTLALKLDGGLHDTLVLAMTLSGPVRAQMTAQTQLSVPGLPLAVTLQSPQLRWPLIGDAQYQADDLHFTMSGKASDYAVALQAAVRGKQIPATALTLNAKGNLEQLSLDKLQLALLQGNLTLTALVDWRKAISWRSELTLAGINTARQYPDWPAKLDGNITTRGSLYGGSWQISVPQLRLRGNVRQNALIADGSLYGNSYHQWQIPALSLALGRNTLGMSGSLGDTLALHANINAPHLNNALPGLGGAVKGTLDARGDLRAPQLLADLTANGLRWQELSIGRIKLASTVSAGEQIQGKLALLIEHVQQGALAISQLRLDASGSEKQHHLTMNVNGKPVSGKLQLSGAFDRQHQQWQGEIDHTRLTTPVGEWQLMKAIALRYRQQQQTASIGPHCWRNANAELCVPKTIDAGPSGQASVDLKRIDLAMLKPFLDKGTSLSGLISGDAAVSWAANGALPEGRVALKGHRIRVVQEVQGNALPVAFDTLDLNAALHNNRAQLDWLVRIAHNGQLNGRVQVDDPQGRRSLSGNVDIARFSLGLFNPALMKGEKIGGMLDSSLRLAGNLRQPQLFGQLGLKNVDIDGNFMPVDLKAANLEMVFNGMSSVLNGQLETAKGTLMLSGDADWRQLDAWRARIAAKGQNIRVTVPPMVRVDVSPDLVFEATPTLLNLDGRVDIPWARITVQEVPESATAVSTDEVLLDKQLKPVTAKTAAIPVNSNLTIHVGKDVRLSAFGLKAKLNGDVKLAQDKRGLGLNGQINIPSGRFHAYGQDLMVRKGELQFSGPPDQPWLNIEATRNPDATADGVTAGVRVIGLANEPKVEIFSDPAMSQQEALSYLLRGQGLNANGSDSGTLTSALVGLGLAQSGQVMGKIGETFGVSNLALDTAGVGDSQQVQVSGYVLPGLQVKYGVGIFDSLATLTLRYRLMPQLYLEAVSGIDQALDLLYQFEF